MGSRVILFVSLFISYSAFAVNRLDPIDKRINRDKPVSPMKMLAPVDENGNFIPISMVSPTDENGNFIPVSDAAYDAQRENRFQQAVQKLDPVSVMDEGTPQEIAAVYGLPDEDQDSARVYDAVWGGAGVMIRVDVASQTLSVQYPGGAYNGLPVSTARSGYYTRRGCYHSPRPEIMHYSNKYENSPMPHSLFYSGGFAIHGTYEQRYLGHPASHGCIRLSLRNAAALYQIVQTYGSGNTTICVE